MKELIAEAPWQPRLAEKRLKPALEEQ